MCCANHLATWISGTSSWWSHLEASTYTVCTVCPHYGQVDVRSVRTRRLLNQAVDGGVESRELLRQPFQSRCHSPCWRYTCGEPCSRWENCVFSMQSSQNVLFQFHQLLSLKPHINHGTLQWWHVFIRRLPFYILNIISVHRFSVYRRACSFAKYLYGLNVSATQKKPPLHQHWAHVIFVWGLWVWMSWVIWFWFTLLISK